MFKVSNKDTGVVLVYFTPCRTYFTPCYSVSIINFEYVIPNLSMKSTRTDAILKIVKLTIWENSKQYVYGAIYCSFLL